MTSHQKTRLRRFAALMVLAASCSGQASFTGAYTMIGTRVSASACMGAPPSGSIGTADVTITAPDSAGTFTMEMRIGTSNACVLTLTESAGTAAITNANNCDATVAPPFFPHGSGMLSRQDGQLQLAVHWVMTGAGSGACTVDDSWISATR